MLAIIGQIIRQLREENGITIEELSERAGIDADKLAKEEGYESWILCFKDHLDNSQAQKDCEAPDVFPWVLDRIDTNGNKFFARRLRSSLSAGKSM